MNLFFKEDQRPNQRFQRSLLECLCTWMTYLISLVGLDSLWDLSLTALMNLHLFFIVHQVFWAFLLLLQAHFMSLIPFIFRILHLKAFYSQIWLSCIIEFSKPHKKAHLLALIVFSFYQLFNPLFSYSQVPLRGEIDHESAFFVSSLYFSSFNLDFQLEHHLSSPFKQK